MFLEDKDIQKVLDTINGRTPEDEVLKDMKVFFKEEFDINILDYICDRTKDGLLRLKIMVWDVKDTVMFLCCPDRELENKIRDRFSKACRDHGLNSEYFDPESYFSVVSDFRSDVEKILMTDDTIKKIDVVLRRHPEVMSHRYSIPTVFVFYKTDEDIETNYENGLSTKIREEISGVLGSVAGFEDRMLGDVRFSSLETFEVRYKGNFHGFWLDH